MSEVPPVRREVLVDASPDVAFRVFTERIGSWWPVAQLSVHGAESAVAFAGDRIVETAPDGSRAVWGTVRESVPGRRLVFTWHPGRDPQPASEVTVTFAAVGARTSVTLVHRGWDAYADPAAARAEYDRGWPTVLDRFAAAATDAGDDDAGSDDAEDGDTWVVLAHSPGAAAPAAGSVFEAPQFAQHIEFLERMRAAGHLIAAGSLADSEGSGMTVLRLAGPGRFEEARAMATRDDGSVACGFFDVVVRPWNVVMHGRQ